MLLSINAPFYISAAATVVMSFLQPAVEVPLSKALNSYSTDQWASDCCPLGKAQWWRFGWSSAVLSIFPTCIFLSTGSKYCGRCQLSKSGGKSPFQHRGQLAFQTRYKDVWGTAVWARHPLTDTALDSSSSLINPKSPAVRGRLLFEFYTRRLPKTVYTDPIFLFLSAVESREALVKQHNDMNNNSQRHRS